ncbi:hypothetical protein P153DRAFT_57525 [Dothidotthia symphoricarpi CBS 119687]|uniref:Uncharacterized protein n=1 Tax=Dothidotthia symphoricarpi CBS 119687 TaxID=1392245 RepID=A0A6A6A5A8_9PLEO|nr:uncharacterized protein P153DRAFT_57525 [Dothidotthia symphoricarpi CBS 119687]KAF2127069.1 hypothetical protein P153DRAFT_57525 [Dothidotthia symphoricarpi CBS 119687]
MALVGMLSTSASKNGIKLCAALRVLRSNAADKTSGGVTRSDPLTERKYTDHTERHVTGIDATRTVAEMCLDTVLTRTAPPTALIVQCTSEIPALDLFASSHAVVCHVSQPSISRDPLFPVPSAGTADSRVCSGDRCLRRQCRARRPASL